MMMTQVNCKGQKTLARSSLFTEGQKTSVNKTRSDKNTVLLDEKLCTAKTKLRQIHVVTRNISKSRKRG